LAFTQVMILEATFLL